MYIVNIASCTKKRCQTIKSKTLSQKTVVKELDFERRSVVSQWSIRREKYLQFFGTELAKKIPDLYNAKEQNQLFIRKKKAKSVKQ